MASKHRLQRGEDYRRIVRSGYRVGGKFCLAHAVLLSFDNPADLQSGARKSQNSGQDKAESTRPGFRSEATTVTVGEELKSQAQAPYRDSVSRETSILRQPRFGFIITKAVGKAVTRNLLRRRLQSICEQAVRNGFSGADVVLRVFPQSAKISYQELEKSVTAQLLRVQERIDAAV